MGDHVDKAGVQLHRRWKLRSLSFDAQKQLHILKYDTPNGVVALRSRAVIMTSPSYVTGKLLRPLHQDAAKLLEQIEHPVVAAVTVEYPRSAFREQEHGKGIVNGFGQLIPRSQGIRTLGTIYCSSLFPDREPDPEKVMLLHFIGGSRDIELFGGIEDLTDEQLVAIAHEDTVTTLLKPSASEVMPHVLGVKVWPRAIPQINIGHNQRLDSVRQKLEAAGVKGMFLAGNYVGGVALGRCVEFGLETAEDVKKFLAPAA